MVRGVGLVRLVRLVRGSWVAGLVGLVGLAWVYGLQPLQIGSNQVGRCLGVAWVWVVAWVSFCPAPTLLFIYIYVERAPKKLDEKKHSFFLYTKKK